MGEREESERSPKSRMERRAYLREKGTLEMISVKPSEGKWERKKKKKNGGEEATSDWAERGEVSVSVYECGGLSYHGASSTPMPPQRGN